MDNKVTKERISVHFEYDWLKYILILIACIISFYFIFFQINATRSFEKIDVFFSCYDNRVKTLANDYKAYIGTEYDDDVIIDSSVEYSSPTMKEYSTLYQTRVITSDVLVLGESYTLYNAYSFLELTDEILSCILPDGLDANALEYFVYTQENIDKMGDLNNKQALLGKRYAIKISSLSTIAVGSDTTPFVFDYYEAYDKEKPETGAYDTEFYMLINSNSVNIGKYNKKEKDRDRYGEYYQAFQFVEYFLVTYEMGLI